MIGDLRSIIARVEHLEARHRAPAGDDFEADMVWTQRSAPTTPASAPSPPATAADALRLRWPITSSGAQTDVSGYGNDGDSAGDSTYDPGLPMTVSWWLLPGATGPPYPGGGAHGGSLTCENDGGLWITGTWVGFPSFFTEGVLAHVAIRAATGFGAQLFVDGSHVASRSTDLAGGDAGCTVVSGETLDFRVYEAYLSASQIAAIHTAGANP